MNTTERSPLQTVAMLVAGTFLAVGILGFVPGVTTHLYGGLDLAGHDGSAELLGIFGVSVLHNLVHLAFGIAGIGLAGRAAGARRFLVGGGAIYLVLWIYGLVIDKDSGANFVPVNSADDWLHFGLGAAMLALGLALSRTASDRRSATAGSVPVG